MKFGEFLKVNFRQHISHFEAQEVMNPALQAVHKSKLKRGSYASLKQTSQRGMLSSKLLT